MLRLWRESQYGVSRTLPLPIWATPPRNGGGRTRTCTVTPCPSASRSVLVCSLIPSLKHTDAECKGGFRQKDSLRWPRPSSHLPPPDYWPPHARTSPPPATSLHGPATRSHVLLAATRRT